jgi:hypothetical protein
MFVFCKHISTICQIYFSLSPKNTALEVHRNFEFSFYVDVNFHNYPKFACNVWYPDTMFLFNRNCISYSFCYFNSHFCTFCWELCIFWNCLLILFCQKYDQVWNIDHFWEKKKKKCLSHFLIFYRKIKFFKKHLF